MNTDADPAGEFGCISDWLSRQLPITNPFQNDQWNWSSSFKILYSQGIGS